MKEAWQNYKTKCDIYITSVLHWWLFWTVFNHIMLQGDFMVAFFVPYSLCLCGFRGVWWVVRQGVQNGVQRGLNGCFYRWFYLGRKVVKIWLRVTVRVTFRVTVKNEMFQSGWHLGWHFADFFLPIRGELWPKWGRKWGFLRLFRGYFAGGGR